ncbi:LYR motif protein [Wolffia australiana]
MTTTMRTSDRGGPSRHGVESCTKQLQSWQPFNPQAEPSSPILIKKPCRSDRSTAPILIDPFDFSNLSLIEDISRQIPRNPDNSEVGWLARKRRRRRAVSRSVSGRSCERNGACRRRCRSVGGCSNYATCSDFPVATVGTDSSGELFVNGDGIWGSEVGELRGKDGGNGNCGMDREISVVSSLQCGLGVVDLAWNDLGYGSETGYRGDAEIGYGDEVDEEEEDGRMLLWGDRFGADGDGGKIDGESSFSEQKIPHRFRRKKHEPCYADPMKI